MEAGGIYTEIVGKLHTHLVNAFGSGRREDVKVTWESRRYFCRQLEGLLRQLV